MELSNKLQQLRKQKHLTQEELAAALYVSRTAVSKWESGRGYPNIESLKAIAEYFDLTIDELLSGDELLTIAQEDNKQTQTHFRDLVFSLLDISVAVFFFLPLFGQSKNGAIQSVPLLSLDSISQWLRVSYIALIAIIIVFGIVTLALQNCRHTLFKRSKRTVSLTLNTAAVALFIISSQPYASTLLFIFLIIKVLILTKKQ